MDKTVSKVMQGFMALDEARRDEFIKELSKYREGKTPDDVLRKSIRESTNTVNFGPAPGGCPCCGR
jgi:hypothetical protein